MEKFLMLIYRKLSQLVGGNAAMNVQTHEQMKVCTFELTRPADTTAYATGDVVANSTSAPTLIELELDSDEAADLNCIVASVRLQTDNTQMAGKAVSAHFFNDQVIAQADNTAYEMLYSNASKRAGRMDVSFDTANGGSTNSVAGINNYDKVFVKPATNKLYLQLQIQSAFTPTSGQKIFGQVGIIVSKRR